MIVAKITPEQAESLKGKKFNGNLFNPIRDKNGNWIISLIELQYIDIDFANTVSLIVFEKEEINGLFKK